MYLNESLIENFNVIFSEELHKETIVDEQRKLAITRVLKKGTLPENDKFYLTQIKSTDAKNDKPTIKFYDNYKVYYEVNDGTCKIIIQDISQKVENKDIDALLDTKMPDNCPTITIEKDGTIYKNKEFLDKQNVLSEYFSRILEEEAKLSNGVDFGINPMVFKLYTILHNSQLKQFPKIEQFDDEDIFKKVEEINGTTVKKTIKLQDNITLDTILAKYGLEILKDDDKKPNFAIVPIMAEGHISTMLIDLRRNFRGKPKDRLNFFDTSGGHISLKDKNLKHLRLNKQNLQLTGCCGYWNSSFIEECSKIEDIKEIKKQFQTGEMQLKIACRVSNIIDMNRHQHNIGFIKQIHLPLQVADEMSSEEYEVGNFIVKRVDSNIEVSSKEYEAIKKCKTSNFIEIKVKDTNKYFLLDRENIYKSLCLDLKGISKLLAENECMKISQNDLKLLKEESKRQRESMIDKINGLCQPIIDEAKSSIDQVNEILKNELNDSHKKASGKISSLSTDVKQEKKINGKTDSSNELQQEKIDDQNNDILSKPINISELQRKLLEANYLKLKFFSEYLNNKYLLISKYDEKYKEVHDNVVKSKQTGVNNKQIKASDKQTTTDNIQQSLADDKQTVANGNQTGNNENNVQKVIEIIKTKADVDKHIEGIKNSDEQNKTNLEKLDKFYNKYIHPDLSEEFGKLQLKQPQQKQTKSLQEQTKLLSSLMSLDQDMQNKLDLEQGQNKLEELTEL